MKLRLWVERLLIAVNIIICVLLCGIVNIEPEGLIIVATAFIILFFNTYILSEYGRSR